MMRRFVFTVALTAPTGPYGLSRSFSSSYGGDFDPPKASAKFTSRSGAHRHTPARSSVTDCLDNQERRSEHRSGYHHASDVLPPDTASEFRDGGRRKHASINGADEEEPGSMQRNVKSHYRDLFKPPPKQISFTTSFDSVVPPAGDAAQGTSGSRSLCRSSAQHKEEPNHCDDSEDVTRFYSEEEVKGLTGDEDPDVDGTNEGYGEADYGGDVTAEGPMASIRNHPFFNNILKQMEKKMLRHRKEIKYAGRYTPEMVNECIRPLLHLADYPFTLHQFSQLTPAVSYSVLKNSLRDVRSCKKLHLYRSMDTDILLDWSAEDFLRRRYESIHISWEPMDTVYRRYGWSPEVMSDRDCLLYFAEFSRFVELAELEMSSSGTPSAIPIDDPVARAERSPIPASRLLIRRKPGAEVEPSVTESIRLMGSPALDTPVKGKQGRRHLDRDSVGGMFSALEQEAEAVEGDEATKLTHAMESVRSMRQATHPSGRVIKEFSLGKQSQEGDVRPSMFNRNKSFNSAAAATAQANETEDGGDELVQSFDSEKYEALSNSYHKAKVEVSLLRRRLLSTDSVDKVAALQDKLSRSRKELARLGDHLARMRELKRTQGMNDGELEKGPISGVGEGGFNVPRSQPKYPEAPEHKATFEKNDDAAEDIDIDLSLDEYDEFETTPMSVTEVFSRKNGDGGSIHREKHRQHDAPTGTAAHSRYAGHRALHKAQQMEETRGEPRDWVEEEEIADHDDATESTAASHELPSDRMSIPTKSEDFARLRKELSSAAESMRREVQCIAERKQKEEAEMQRRLDNAVDALKKTEERLFLVDQQERAVREAEERAAAEKEERRVRAAAEAKAREVEEELRVQRERRQEELRQEREKARQAQVIAQKALERQKKAEQDALAVEEELLRKLQEVRAHLRKVSSGNTSITTDAVSSVTSAEVASATKEEEDASNREWTVSASRTSEWIDKPSPPQRAAVPASRDSGTPARTSPTSTSSPSNASPHFMCTPEQYDGLHLASDRLRKEIACLEGQMEQENNEDDETLMAVLAASRADLEELDECIESVQKHAPWAANQDAKREAEFKQLARTGDPEARQVQSRIDTQRFNISLLEKRLHHTTERSIINKLEQGIIKARREISRLRAEQDRLRRAGRDTYVGFGLPNDISLVETLSEEVRDTDTQREAKEMRDAVEGESVSRTKRVSETEDHDGTDVVADAEDIAAEAAASGNRLDPFDDEEADDGENAYSPNAPSRRDGQNQTAEGERLTSVGDNIHLPGAAPSVGDAHDPEAHRLRLRLDGMLKDIQHLQDNILIQERTQDYDDEETEAVLVEMKNKLGQLLRLRDDIQRRLLRPSAGGTLDSSRTSNSDLSLAPSSEAHAATGARATIQHFSHEQQPQTSRVTSAGRRVQMMARKRKASAGY